MEICFIIIQHVLIRALLSDLDETTIIACLNIAFVIVINAVKGL